ncbi:MAG: hypothetical protein JWM95_4993 [Gemmatimonadetes bacterium]|nr:hypothetical protein [Gemmatimonadota bacterium]
MRSGVVLVAAMALATWICGWWGVALVGIATGVLYRARGGRAWHAALAATMSWALLLIADAIAGPFAHVASTLGGAMSIPAGALLMATLLFPALLAWSAAMVAAQLSSLTLSS